MVALRRTVQTHAPQCFKQMRWHQNVGYARQAGCKRTVTVWPIVRSINSKNRRSRRITRAERDSACQLYSNSPLLSYSPFYGILTIFMILFEAGRYISFKLNCHNCRLCCLLPLHSILFCWQHCRVHRVLLLGTFICQQTSVEPTLLNLQKNGIPNRVNTSIFILLFFSCYSLLLPNWDEFIIYFIAVLMMITKKNTTLLTVGR